MDFNEESSHEGVPEEIQDFQEKHKSIYNFRESPVIREKDLMCLSFPQKLWEIVENEEFQSVRWNDEGDCVAIDEELFKLEVLERKAKIFETDNMKSFNRQLNLYGFSKIRQNQRFLPQSMEEKNKTISSTKLYHNANFKREFPLLIRRMKRKVATKKKFSSNTSLTKHTRIYSSKRKNIVKKYLKKPNIQLKDENKTYDPSSPAKSSQCPSNCTIDENVDLSPTNSIGEYVPANSTMELGHVMDLENLHSTPPHIASMHAHFTTLMSFFNPWFSMSMLSAATSVRMTEMEHLRLSPTNQFCPSCSCGRGSETSRCHSYRDSDSAIIMDQE
ncbi:uncharacterized protein O3C94_013054 [Discoglossus pictus]